jgi:hypothetical protein
MALLSVQARQVAQQVITTQSRDVILHSQFLIVNLKIGITHYSSESQLSPRFFVAQPNFFQEIGFKSVTPILNKVEARIFQYKPRAAYRINLKYSWRQKVVSHVTKSAVRCLRRSLNNYILPKSCKI